ncbi:MAG: response regulator [Hyphomicrobiales bacterium]|nr:response regulator [Hyphomicrobiales bacterium]
MAKRAITVDDSKTMRDMVSFTLKGAGFEVLEAEDGKHALEVLGQGSVDLVVTDLNMPNMNGIELIRALRAKPNFQATPILMLTTEADGAKKDEGRAAGATGWIVKPFQPDKLIAVVNKVCA